MKTICLGICFLLMVPAGWAQTQDKEEINHQQIEKTQEGHKFFLNSDKPVREIKDVKHDDGTPVDFSLSPERQLVNMYDYKGNGGVNVTVVYEDGTEGEMRKTPCDIFEDKIIL